MSRVYFYNSPLEPEIMGLFGFSWQEKVAKFISKQLKGTAAAKKLKSFWGGSGMNTKLVKNLYREYTALMASGYKPSSFTVKPNSAGTGGTFSTDTISLAGIISNKTNVDSSIVLSFLRALFVLARDGKIDYAKWNPAGYQESKTLTKTFSPVSKALSTVTKATTTTTKTVSALSIGIAAVAGLYLYTQFSGKKRS